MSDGQIVIDTKVDTNGAQQGIDSLRNSLGGFAKVLGIAFVADKIKDFGQSILETGISFDAMKEQSEIAWGSLLGSQKQAVDMFNEITNFAAATPFSQMGVDSMAKQLFNAGFHGKELFNQLTKFGDLGSAFSIPESSLGEMVRQYSQVNQAQVVYTEDLNILQDRGVPIYKALADVMGVNVSQVRKMASQGKITASIYDKAIDQVAKKYQGAMAKQSASFKGVVSTLKDNWNILAGTLAKPIFGPLKKYLVDVGDKLQDFNKLAGENGFVGAIKKMFPSMVPLVKILTDLGHILINTVLPMIKEFFIFIGEHAQILFVVAGIIGSLVLAFKAFTIIQTIISIIEGLGVVFGILEAATVSEAGAQMALNLAFLTSPIFWIIAAIIAVVGAFIYLWNTSEGFRNFWIGLWNGIKSITKKVVDGIVKAFKAVINFFKNDWKQILLFLVNPIAGAFALLYKHCTKFRNFINKFVNGIKNFITKTIPKIISDIGKWFGQLPGKIGYALGFALGKVILWGSQLISKAIEIGSNFLHNIINFFIQLPGVIWNWLINTINKVQAWEAQMIAKAISAGSNFLHNVINFFMQLPGNIANFLANVISNIINWASNMASYASQAGSQFISNVINFFEQLPGRIASFLGNAISAVINWGANLASAGYNSAMSLVHSVVDTIKSIPGRMLSLGGDIVRGKHICPILKKFNIKNRVKSVKTKLNRYDIICLGID